MRSLRMLVLIVVVVLVQVTLFPHLRIAGVAPDLGLVVALAVGYHDGPEAGAIAGFGAGFGFDLFLETPLGLNALAYALLSLVVLIAYAIVVGGIRQDLTVWLDMIARLLAGSVPFIALGFSIGYLCGPNVAPAVANLVYLPLSFASGLFMPLSQLPGFVRGIAPYLPAYHYGQLGWSAVGANTERLPVSLAWLAGYTLLFLAIAIRAYRNEESRKFG